MKQLVPNKDFIELRNVFNDLSFTKNVISKHVNFQGINVARFDLTCKSYYAP